eukprot:CAMPEP_0171185864 /NCGR_PEP_ID=MMETSP0790-20130122/16518_1 /TAXON_ID=2925 /ORGANISM="Alexandrium catenella, Strain OF101" /LENGTH=125 /DNA_ID=CAMNT_0011650893 /DNA_START=97 /DNA_END=470 /DNA_ORIENTATION=+
MVCVEKNNSQSSPASGKSGSPSRSPEAGTRAAPESKGSMAAAMILVVVLVISLDTVLLEWLPSAMAGATFEGSSTLVYVLSIGGGYLLLPLFLYYRSRRSAGRSSAKRSGPIKPARKQARQPQRG